MMDFPGYFPPDAELHQYLFQPSFLPHGHLQDLTEPASNPSSLKSSLPPGFVLPEDGEADEPLPWTSDWTASQDGLEDLFELPQETSLNITSPEGDLATLGTAPTSGEKQQRRPPRKQNHACDQCRTAKRACNFKSEVTTYRQKPLFPCRTCTKRNLECTVAWLEKKRTALQIAKEKTKPQHHSTVPMDTSEDNREYRDSLPQGCQSLTLMTDAQLLRQFLSREACVKHFNLYVDVLDMPMSHCLLQGMIPRRYSLGVAALRPLSESDSFSAYSKTADMWVSSCWDAVPGARASLAVDPHLFRTASVLDSVFDSPEQRPRPPASSTRDQSLNATYKWVALATAAQFSINATGFETYSRDLAYAAWRKARQMAFDNISATGSFRLALALVLFGLIEAPRHGSEARELQEASTYAVCEGVKRLQLLCRRARRCLEIQRGGQTGRCQHDAGSKDYTHPAHRLPPEVQDNLLELVAALEWLFIIINATKIVLSRGRVQPLGEEFEQPSVGSWFVRYETTRMLSLELPEIQQTDGPSSEPVTQPSDRDDSVEAVTTLWRKDAPESTMLRRLQQSGMLVILLWNAIARLTAAAKSMPCDNADLKQMAKWCTEINFIIKVWRASFGAFDEMPRSSFEQGSTEFRRMAAFCSNDGDLAILLYHNMVQSLEKDLSQMPASEGRCMLQQQLQSSEDFLNHQRLLSALQVSAFASCRVGASTGIHGIESLKAQLQDLGAHPYPLMVVRATQLAAITLSEELHRLVARMESQDASKLAVRLNDCLAALQVLQNSLVTFPEIPS